MGLYDLEKYEDAIRIHQEVLAIKKVKNGPDDRSTLTTMTNLANCYHSLHRYEHALKLRRETLELFTARFGPDDYSTLMVTHNIGANLRALGRFAEALRLDEETLRGARPHSASTTRTRSRVCGAWPRTSPNSTSAPLPCRSSTNACNERWASASIGTSRRSLIFDFGTSKKRRTRRVPQDGRAVGEARAHRCGEPVPSRRLPSRHGHGAQRRECLWLPRGPARQGRGRPCHGLAPQGCRRWVQRYGPIGKAQGIRLGA